MLVYLSNLYLLLFFDLSLLFLFGFVGCDAVCVGIFAEFGCFLVSWLGHSACYVFVVACLCFLVFCWPLIVFVV
uniref:Uncharacterized protein n=1 Tax=Anopheles darlingi TaxID=43151 RepID=A0A2M4D9B0_ANODA